MKPLRRKLNKKNFSIVLKDEYIPLLDLPHRGPHLAYSFDGSEMFILQLGEKKVAALKAWCESFKPDPFVSSPVNPD